MRRIIAGLMVVLTVLSLCGCGNTDAPPKGSGEEGTPQVSDRPAASSEQPTETESQTPSVPESLFMKYVDDQLQNYERDHVCLSSDYTITREADESVHQEAVIIDVTMVYEYFTIMRETSVAYQYYSSDDVWQVIQEPHWSTVYEEMHWDKMLGTWIGSSEYLQYTINIKDIDLENMTFTFSYDILSNSWGHTDSYTGSGTFEFDENYKSKFRLDGSPFQLTFSRDGVSLYNFW